MICSSCRVQHHEDCKGGTHCTCQHRVKQKDSGDHRALRTDDQAGAEREQVMARRPCLDCGRICEGSRCKGCRQAREQRRGTRHERGYDSRHEETRRRLLPLAYGKPCPRCGKLMVRGQRLDLGHTVPLRQDPASRGDRIEHASCNRAERD